MYRTGFKYFLDVCFRVEYFMKWPHRIKSNRGRSSDRVVATLWSFACQFSDLDSVLPNTVEQAECVGALILVIFNNFSRHGVNCAFQKFQIHSSCSILFKEKPKNSVFLKRYIYILKTAYHRLENSSCKLEAGNLKIC